MKKAIIWDLLGTLGGSSQTLITENFTFFDEAIPALKKAQTHGFLNLIVTNQSQIARGRMTREAYNQSLEKLIIQLSEISVDITAVYTCPHRREDRCTCKKPQVLFVEAALSQHQLDRNECYIIGDSGPNDMLLARNARMKSVLVLTGDGIRSLTTGRSDWQEAVPTYIAENCLVAVESILQDKKERL